MVAGTQEESRKRKIMAIFKLVRKISFEWESMAQKNVRGTFMLL